MDFIGYETHALQFYSIPSIVYIALDSRSHHPIDALFRNEIRSLKKYARVILLKDEKNKCGLHMLL